MNCCAPCDLLCRAATVATKNLVTGALNSPSNTIIVNGNILVTQEGASNQAISFIAENMVIGGVQQWKLVRHDDFEDGADGWSLLETSSCHGNSDKFLGGHFKIGHGEAVKTFANLPPHKQVGTFTTATAS